MKKDIYSNRLAALRALMTEGGLGGFIVPCTDEFQGEYTPPHAARLAWLTGFTGSAGTAVILQDKAAVLTDGRYTVQARAQLDAEFYEIVDSTQVTTGDWLTEHAGEEAVIGYDPWLHTPVQIEKIQEKFKGELRAAAPNPIDTLWQDRPVPPSGRVEIYPDKYAGKSAVRKQARIADHLEKEKLYGFLFTLPDSLCWLLNVRGGDLAHTPVVLSYALITQDANVTWFVDRQKIAKIESELAPSVQVVDIADIESWFEKFAAKAGKKPAGLDFETAPLWFKSKFEALGLDVENMKDPSIPLKAIKNETEQKTIRQAHVMDGAAMVRFLFWLENAVQEQALSEIDVAQKLLEFRGRAENFRGESFPAIAGFGPNGAIVHYRATPESHSMIEPPGLLLIDSGGQYFGGGTTDITRTIALGEPTEEMRKNFTHVLKGHIALARARFTRETTGIELDEIARDPLKKAGLDYAHGTGHGVGCYLGVHERGAGISPRSKGTLEPGMVLSNEPGYYKEGAYGIRIENLVLVEEDRRGGLYFETLSLVPVDRKLIVKELLTVEEKAWLNEYHSHVFSSLSVYLDEDETAWLADQTAPL